MDICLQVLKESNKSRFDSYSVRNSVLFISHTSFRDCCVHIFSDNLSLHSCIYYSTIMSFYQIRSRERAKYEAVIHCSVLV